MAHDRVVHHGSERAAPAGAELIGEVDPSDSAKLTITVRRRNPLPPSTAWAAPMNRSDFAAQYGADPDDLQAVADYAASAGLTVERSDAASRTVRVIGNISALTQAFNADLRMYRQSGVAFRARTGTLSIPTALHGIIEGIFGFDQRPQARTHFRIRETGGLNAGVFQPRASGDVSYSPLDVAKIYQFPQGTGAGQTIGIIELGGGFTAADLANYFTGLGVNPQPNVTAVGVDGASNQPAGDPNSADGEVLLDIEVAGSIAPAANIVVYFGTNTTQGFLDAITTAIHDANNKPGIISISWGGPENTYNGQALTAYDQAFQDAGALGVSVCVAAGDDGSSDGANDRDQRVDFPASSPNVLACGGTNLQAKNDLYGSETVWNEGTGNGATGGGVSETFPLPSYQSAAGVPPSVNASAFAGRGVPDVAGDADPASGYNVLIDGQNTVIGGTSAVAPLWAALIALLNQSLGKNVGFLNPALYTTAAGAFHDVTQGNNGAYSAGAGWDACTGLGSPIGSEILQALQGAVLRQPVLNPPAPSNP